MVTRNWLFLILQCFFNIPHISWPKLGNQIFKVCALAKISLDLLGRCSWWNWTMASHRCPTWLLRHTEPLPLLCLCYAFAMPLLCLPVPAFLILFYPFAMPFLLLSAESRCHAPSSDCGRALWWTRCACGRGEDGDMQGVSRFSFHRSFLFFVISNERYLQICDTRTWEKEIENPQNLHSSCGLSCCSSWTRLLCWLRSYLAAESWVMYFLLKRLALTTKRIKRPTFGGQICASLNIISLPLVHHVFLLHYRCVSAVICIHPSCITRWM